MTEKKRRRRFGKIQQQRSGRYQASYIDPRNGTRATAPNTFRTKTDADRWLVRVEADLHRDDLPDASLARMTFADWSTRWLDTRQIKPKTYVRYESTVRCHLVPFFGRMRLGAIARANVVDFVNELSNRRAEGTVEGIRRILASIMEEAVQSQAIRQNPTAGIRVRRSRREEMIFLSRDEVSDLSHAISRRPIKRRGGRIDIKHDPAYGLMVRFTTETGLRAGEIAALRIGRLDLENRRVHVAESVAEVKAALAPGGLAYGEPKTYERRSVPLPAGLVDDLRKHLNTRPSDPKAFLFLSPDGKPLRHSNFYDRVYKPAVLRAGLDPDTRFHDLRHTYAALLIAAGANALTVKQRMGHSSITVTMDRYGHLFPHLEEAITDRMDEAYKAAHLANTTEGLGCTGDAGMKKAEAT